MKNKMTAIILSVLLGGLGVDRFYLGYIGLGVLKLLTAGCFGILYIIDIILICTGSLQPADGTPYEEDAANTAQRPSAAAASNGAAEELLKYKNLMDQGVITEAEFNRKKAQLLDLL